MIALVCLSLLSLTLAFLARYQKSTYAMCLSTKRLDGKTALVTGGTAGIGLQIATDFANRGARVIIACPFEEEGKEGRRTIVEKTNSEKVVFIKLDLSSLASVRQFAKDVINTEERLDILVNNAGVIFEQKATEDGMSFMMQVNYFGHFLLTLLLLPLLKRTGRPSEPSRIVNITSLAHRMGKIDVRQMNFTQGTVTSQLYANSKLCLILFSRELSKKLQGSNVVINNADPGFVGGTSITKSSNKVIKCFIYCITPIASPFIKTPLEGAQTAIHTALDTAAGAISGEMYSNCKLARATSLAYDEDLAKKVWNESLKLVKLSSEEHFDLETMNEKL